MKRAIIFLGSIFCCCVMMTALAESSNGATTEKPVILVKADQPTFSIRLVSNPTTGYAWYLRSYDANLVQPVRRVFEAPKDKKLIGAPGYEVWTFRVKPAGFVVPMQMILRFVYARQWEVNGEAEQAVFHVTTVAG